MVNQLNRPVPEWCISFSSAGTAEPVKTNCPTSRLWSISNLMASHNFGANCHSSISLGVSPSSNTEASISAISRLVANDVGLSIYKMLFACCSAVVVFPHHLGPSINMAPLLANFFASIWSAILCLYSISSNDLIYSCKYTSFFCYFLSWRIFISSVGAISLPQLARFRFLSWRK